VKRLLARFRAWRREAFGVLPLPEDGPGFRTVPLPPGDPKDPYVVIPVQTPAGEILWSMRGQRLVVVPDPQDDGYVIVTVQLPSGEIRWRVPREPLAFPAPETPQEAPQPDPGAGDGAGMPIAAPSGRAGAPEPPQSRVSTPPNRLWTV
jgi:hypothetical protein